MPDKPPLYKQETVYSCAPACLRMVLESLGVVKSEQELRELCDCLYDSVILPGGTDPFKLKVAAQALGFAGSQTAKPSFDELKSELKRGLYPIVYVKTHLVQGKPPESHAVVVVRIKKDSVDVLDPWRGKYTFSTDDFLAEWKAAHQITILVEK